MNIYFYKRSVQFFTRRCNSLKTIIYIQRETLKSLEILQYDLEPLETQLLRSVVDF